MIFAFGHSEDTYFIGNGKRSFWTGVPNSLATYLRKNHPLRALSFGEESWFYSEAPHDGTNGIHSLAPDTPHRYPDVQDIFDSGEPINWIAFGPDGQYVVDTKDKIYHSNPGAVRRKRGGAQIPLRCASFGWNGSWIYVDEDGTVRSGGLAGTIKSALKTKAIRVSGSCISTPDLTLRRMSN
ncbi:hypothetical protein FB45DRAFT_924241 [Roridomyces roridus]|uniref:Uncharacterized protein n=1 Tax=Roridomyces roridus TaxID=1738132 RepID=A0AAD7BMD9_9AGAR|nr:hypothetical protein FB45DRAFT_924241 [Roridomyces roridus]